MSPSQEIPAFYPIQCIGDAAPNPAAMALQHACSAYIDPSYAQGVHDVHACTRRIHVGLKTNAVIHSIPFNQGSAFQNLFFLLYFSKVAFELCVVLALDLTGFEREKRGKAEITAVGSKLPAVKSAHRRIL
jgi:hypothetical protein